MESTEEQLDAYRLLITDIIETLTNRGDSSVAQWIQERALEIEEE